MRLSVLGPIVLVLLALHGRAALADEPPKVGDPAPALQLAGALDDQPLPTLAELKGKAVVLEFWALWCPPCISAFPHLNELVKQFAGKPVEFLSVTSSSDSPPENVRRLLEKRPLKTRVVFDKEHATFQAYGVRVIPMTVLIDPSGNVAAVTEPDQVTAEVLDKLIAGEPLNLPERRQQGGDMDWAKAAGIKPTDATVGQVLLEHSTATAGGSRVASDKGEIAADGVGFSVLVQLAYGAEPHEADVPDDLYEGAAYRVWVSAADPEKAQKMLQGVLHAHFSFEATWEETEKEIPVLRRADGQSGEPQHASFRPGKGDQGGGAHSGNIVAKKVGMRFISGAIGSYGFDGPIVDETGLAGEYDIELRWVPGDRDSLLAALREIGLEVTMERRPVRMLRIGGQ